MSDLEDKLRKAESQRDDFRRQLTAEREGRMLAERIVDEVRARNRELEANTKGESMKSEEQQKFEAWGIVDLFGHQRLAGRITEQAIGGCSFVRVDVPAVDGQAEHTRLFGNGAIYGISFTSEDVARQVAQALKARPVSPWDLPRAPALPDSTAHDTDG